MVKIGYIPSARGNYGSMRNTSVIKYIVIHFTANDGDRDTNNGNYFKNNVVKASAHYFVDDDSITRSVKDNYVAYAVGGSKWADCAKTGGGKMYGKITNTNSISIEMCDTIRDGKYQASAKTIKNTVDLIVSLLVKYNLKPTAVYRHFDVNGKHCPVYLMEAAAWNSFKKKVKTAYNKYVEAKEADKTVDKKTQETNKPANETTSPTKSETKYTQKQFIKDIQKSLGLTGNSVDGIGGPTTLSKTVTISASTNKKHKAVKYIQKYLNSLGYNCGDEDGIAGAKFTSAVKKYQTKVVGLKNPDGVITAKNATWKKLLGI